jgi:hypothetical protein
MSQGAPSPGTDKILHAKLMAPRLLCAWRRCRSKTRTAGCSRFAASWPGGRGNFQKAFLNARQSLDELPEFGLLWRGNSRLILSDEARNAGRILDAQDKILLPGRFQEFL